MHAQEKQPWETINEEKAAHQRENADQQGDLEHDHTMGVFRLSVYEHARDPEQARGNRQCDEQLPVHLADGRLDLMELLFVESSVEQFVFHQTQEPHQSQPSLHANVQQIDGISPDSAGRFQKSLCPRAFIIEDKNDYDELELEFEPALALELALVLELVLTLELAFEAALEDDEEAAPATSTRSVTTSRMQNAMTGTLLLKDD